MRVIATIRAWARPRRPGTHPRADASHRALTSAGVVIVFLAALGLAACGATAPGSAGGGNCGTVHSGAGGQFTQGTSTTMDCFWQAYSHCQSATLTFIRMGVDTSDTHTLTIQPGSNGSCTVKDTVSFFQASGGHHSTQTYQCGGMRQSSGGLVVEQCGAEGSLVIPAPNGTPVPTAAP